MDTITNDEYLTTEEAASLLKVTRNTVLLWCQTGEIDARKFGGRWRIPKAQFKDHEKV